MGRQHRHPPARRQGRGRPETTVSKESTLDDALILTLRLDEAAFRRLDELRRTHFPPARNHLRAHLTLFHALPGEELEAIRTELRGLCAATPPLALRLGPPRSLGRGVAFAVEGDSLPALRARLAARWRDRLTPQDRQGWRPHVTVQNKETPEAARVLLARLRDAFVPVPVAGEGLLLHRYLGGPWDTLEDFRFGG